MGGYGKSYQCSTSVSVVCNIAILDYNQVLLWCSPIWYVIWPHQIGTALYVVIGDNYIGIIYIYVNSWLMEVKICYHFQRMCKLTWKNFDGSLVIIDNNLVGNSDKTCWNENKDIVVVSSEHCMQGILLNSVEFQGIPEKACSNPWALKQNGFHPYCYIVSGGTEWY